MFTPPNGPAVGASAIAPSDANTIPVTRGIYVGTAGDLKADFVNGGTVTLKGLAAGIVHPLRLTRVYATGTSAADIVGLY